MLAAVVGVSEVVGGSAVVVGAAVVVSAVVAAVVSAVVLAEVVSLVATGSSPQAITLNKHTGVRSPQDRTRMSGVRLSRRCQAWCQGGRGFGSEDSRSRS